MKGHRSRQYIDPCSIERIRATVRIPCLAAWGRMFGQYLRAPPECTDLEVVTCAILA